MAVLPIDPYWKRIARRLIARPDERRVGRG